MLKCQICGIEHPSMISPSHLKKHGLTGGEYKLKFPGSILRIQSDISRLKASASKKGKPAWNIGIKTGPNIKLSQSVKGEPKPKLRGYDRIWDCGTTKWILKSNK